jgi:excisionase family DNA binding protein
MDNDPLLTVKEVAERLRLNPRTILRWIQRGKLPGIGFGSDRAGYRIRASEVELLLRGEQTQQRRLSDDDTKKLAA